MSHSYLTPNKEDNYLSKSQKVHNQSREGDWVCLNCNNLNFSFRKKCNRCKTQTKKDNQNLQSAYEYYFCQDPYNQFMYQQQNRPKQNFSEHDCPRIANSQQINLNQDILQLKDHGNQTPVKMIDNFTPFKQIQNIQSELKMSKNQKLNTPNSKRKLKNSKVLLQLPSVSPLLKKYQAHQMQTACDTSLPVLFSDDLWGSHIKVVNFNTQEAGKNNQYKANRKDNYFWEYEMNQNEDESNQVQKDENYNQVQKDGNYNQDDFDLSDIISKIMI